MLIGRRLLDEVNMGGWDVAILEVQVCCFGTSYGKRGAIGARIVLHIALLGEFGKGEGGGLYPTVLPYYCAQEYWSIRVLASRHGGVALWKSSCI